MMTSGEYKQAQKIRNRFYLTFLTFVVCFLQFKSVKNDKDLTTVILYSIDSSSYAYRRNLGRAILSKPKSFSVNIFNVPSQPRQLLKT